MRRQFKQWTQYNLFTEFNSIKPLYLLLFVYIFIVSQQFARPDDLPNGGRLPRWSPDGKKIAFLSSSPHNSGSLWIMNSDGNEAHKLLLGDVNDYSWSIESQKIHYISFRNGAAHLFEYSLDDKETLAGCLLGKPISLLPQDVTEAVWSSNGQWVAYLAASTVGRDLWVVQKDGAHRIQLTSGLWIQNPHWIENDRKIIYQVGQTMLSAIFSTGVSTDGKKQLVFHGFCGVMSVSHDKKRIAFTQSAGKGQHILVVMNTDSTAKKEFALPGNKGTPVKWSPDDKQFAYTGEMGTTIGIWVINANGTKPIQITPKTIHGSNPEWSPDGKLILFSGKSQKSFGLDIFTIGPLHGVPNGGKKLHRLTQSSYSEWAPEVSPDGSQIAFFTNQSKNTQIEIVTRDGKLVSKISNIQPHFDSRILWSADGKKIILISDTYLESCDIANPANHPLLNFPNGLLSVDLNHHDGQLLVCTIRNGQPHILIGKSSDSLVMDLSELRIKNHPEISPNVVDLVPQWSPDGKEIAFIGNGHLWIMDTAGAHSRENYNPDSTSNRNPTRVISNLKWSPLGNQLLFTMDDWENQTVYKEIWMINRDGSNPRKLYQEPLLSEFSLFEHDYTYPPLFTPDGKYIYFTSDKDGNPNIFRIPTSGGESQKMTSAGGVFQSFLPEEDVMVYTSTTGNVERIKIKDLAGQTDGELLVK